MITLKKVALSIGIAVVFAFFVFSFVDLFLTSPEHRDFCDKSEFIDRPVKLPTANCSHDFPEVDGCYSDEGTVRYEYDAQGCPVSASCDYCSRDYSDAREKFNVKRFYISAPFGVAALLVGLFLPLTIEAIASGLILGGIAVIAVGTAMAFGDLSKVIRFLVLSVELFLLILVGYLKCKDSATCKKKKK